MSPQGWVLIHFPLRYDRAPGTVPLTLFSQKFTAKVRKEENLTADHLPALHYWNESTRTVKDSHMCMCMYMKYWWEYYCSAPYIQTGGEGEAAQLGESPIYLRSTVVPVCTDGLTYISTGSISESAC